MNNLQTHINNYLEHCRHQKRLDSKTLKAYRIDLQQFYAIFHAGMFLILHRICWKIISAVCTRSTNPKP